MGIIQETMNKLSPSQSAQLQEIGTYLKQQRLDKSLTLDEIAASTMIRAHLLKALEETNSEELPELIYVKGFVRRYGEVLGLDGKALAARLVIEEGPAISEALAPSVTSDFASKAPGNNFPEVGGNLSWLYFLLGGLGILGGLLYFLTRPPQPKPVVRKPNPVAVVSPKPQPKLQPSPSPVAIPPSPTSPLSVKVKLEQDAWLKVTIDGKPEYVGILKSGEEKTWTAKKAISLRSGNAGALKLSVNNQPLKFLGKLGEVKEITVTPQTQPTL